MLRCCSTILPTIASLLGFIVVKFTTSKNPNYPPLTLSLSQNNPNIEEDKNPIPFNAPGLYYQCQPGKCVYEVASAGNPIHIDDTSELYFFCGNNAMLGNSTETCSILDSTNIVDQISQYGAFGVENAVTDVPDVSAHAETCLTLS